MALKTYWCLINTFWWLVDVSCSSIDGWLESNFFFFLSLLPTPLSRLEPKQRESWTGRGVGVGRAWLKALTVDRTQIGFVTVSLSCFGEGPWGPRIKDFSFCAVSLFRMGPIAKIQISRGRGISIKWSFRGLGGNSWFGTILWFFCCCLKKKGIPNAF